MPQFTSDSRTVPFLDVAAGIRELRREIDGAVARVIDSGWYIGGSELRSFERQWADYCGARAAVGAGNGLDALTLALAALDIGAGDRVVVPSWTFIATWLAVSRLRGVPVPVEVDPATGNLDPDRLEPALADARVRAIVVVHLYGQPVDMGRIGRLAAERGLPVVEDAAQAHGARWQGRRTGSLGAAAAFSFYPTKNLAALGDGGAIVSDDPILIERARRLGNYGSSEKYVHTELGINSRLDPLHAAVLSERLRVLDEWNARRAAIAAAYLDGLADIPWLELPHVIDGAEPVWHLFVIRTPFRDRLRDHLDVRGIRTGLHYPIANHRTPVYRGDGFEMPIADRLAAQSLSLPIGPHLSGEDAERVIDVIRSFSP